MWAFVIGGVVVPGAEAIVIASQEPWYVFRVPPGDGSSLELAIEQELCSSQTLTTSTSIEAGEELTMQLGGEVTMCEGLGVMICETTGVEENLTESMSLTTTRTGTDEQEKCLSFSSVFTASGGGLLSGDDATVFIGGGEVWTLGMTNYIDLDTSFSVQETQTAMLLGSQPHSVYMYTRHYIENSLLPNLEEESTDDGLTQEQQDEALASWNFFTTLLSDDLDAISNAVADTAFSFSEDGDVSDYTFSGGGFSFEMGVATGQSFTSSQEVSVELEADFESASGFTFDETGFDYVISTTSSTESSEEVSESESVGQTMTFVLADDDINDQFTFSLQRDLTWGMPVFKVTAGQSSCPWEGGLTQAIDTAYIAIEVDVQENVPPDSFAIFNLTLHNNSGVQADGAYELEVMGESNTDGAIVMAGSVNISSGSLGYTIASGTSLEVPITVYRGPIEYEYNDINLRLASTCEIDISGDIGYGANPQLASFQTISVSFTVPCSESRITSPGDDWVHNGVDGDTIDVNVVDYDLTEDTFDSLSLQYRPEGFDNWYVAKTIGADSLGADYSTFEWDVTNVPDDSYELRTVASCSGGGPDGTSAIVTGVIDRTTPGLFGLPSPSDGVLNLGDVISITFDEPIDVTQIHIIAAQTDNIRLYVKELGTSSIMDIDFTYSDNTIVIEPVGWVNYEYENQTLAAIVKELYDYQGNVLPDSITWEFYVNTNPVGWVGTDITGVTLYIDEEYSTTKVISNYGSSNHSWYAFGGRDEESGTYPNNQLEIPEWLDVSPLSGTLEPGHSQDITISLADGLGYGTYRDTIYAGVDSEGDEPLNIDIRKLCYEPDWTINPSGFQYSMSMTAILLKHLSQAVVDTSTDTYDMVGAFVGDELRGVASVEYLHELESLPNFHPYELFLTIYSNESSGEELSFKVWNATDCALLGNVQEDYVFVADSILGSLTSPETLTATSHIVQENALSSGWTWISQNTVDDSMSINYLLSSLSPVSGDMIKGHGPYSVYSESSQSWVGTLENLDHQKTYLLNISNQDTMTTIGYAVDVELDTIDIVDGWNWIGYTPQQSYTINDALESLDNLESGDLIKSQYGFSEYLENYGWFGSIDYMEPHLGYMLNAANNDTLLYPFTIAQSQSQGTFNNYTAGHQGQDLKGKRSQIREVAETNINTINENAPGWSVDPQQYPGSMSITGVLSVFDELQSGSWDMVGAFINDTCRGIGQLKYVEPLEQYFVFMTIYGNDLDDGSVIVFQVYHEETDEVLYVPESLPFNVNDVVGSLDEPFIWDARYLMVGDHGYIPDVFSLSQNYPNPFNPVTKIGYGIPEKCGVTITVYNIMGEQVATIVDGSKEPGYYFTTWDSRNDRGSAVSSGIYLYQIQAKNFFQTRKMLIIK